MKFQHKMFLLAILVVSCFIASAIVISYRNYWLFTLFLLGGFLLISYGIKLKRIYYAKETEG